MESKPVSGHGEPGHRTENHVSHAEIGRLSGLMESVLYELREFKQRALWRLDNLEDRVETLEHRKDHTHDLNSLHEKVSEVKEYQAQRKIPNKWMDRIFTSVVAGVVMLVLTNFDWIVKVFS